MGSADRQWKGDGGVSDEVSSSLPKWPIWKRSECRVEERARRRRAGVPAGSHLPIVAIADPLGPFSGMISRSHREERLSETGREGCAKAEPYGQTDGDGWAKEERNRSVSTTCHPPPPPFLPPQPRFPSLLSPPRPVLTNSVDICPFLLILQYLSPPFSFLFGFLFFAFHTDTDTNNDHLPHPGLPPAVGNVR